MARVGFTKTYANKAAALADPGGVVALIKTYAVAAGFAVRTDTADLFEFWCNRGAYDLDEDRPRYRLWRHVVGLWRLQPVLPDWSDGSYQLSNLGFDVVGVDASVRVRACFDGDLGVWWLSISHTTDRFEAMVCTRQQRLPVDVRPGIAPRFGALYFNNSNMWWLLRPPVLCVTTAWGAVGAVANYGLSSTVWSPLYNDEAYANSMLAAAGLVTSLPMLAPVFASGAAAGAPIYAGELQDVMLATSDFTEGQMVLPGWRVYDVPTLSDTRAAAVVLRVPAAFDDLDVV